MLLGHNHIHWNNYPYSLSRLSMVTDQLCQRTLYLILVPQLSGLGPNTEILFKYKYKYFYFVQINTNTNTAFVPPSSHKYLFSSNKYQTNKLWHSVMLKYTYFLEACIFGVNLYHGKIFAYNPSLLLVICWYCIWTGKNNGFIAWWTQRFYTSVLSTLQQITNFYAIWNPKNLLFELYK